LLRNKRTEQRLRTAALCLATALLSGCSSLGLGSGCNPLAGRYADPSPDRREHAHLRALLTGDKGGPASGNTVRIQQDASQTLTVWLGEDTPPVKLVKGVNYHCEGGTVVLNGKSQRRSDSVLFVSEDIAIDQTLSLNAQRALVATEDVRRSGWVLIVPTSSRSKTEHVLPRVGD